MSARRASPIARTACCAICVVSKKRQPANPTVCRNDRQASLGPITTDRGHGCRLAAVMPASSRRNKSGLSYLRNFHTLACAASSNAPRATSMKLSRSTLSVALLAVLAAPAAHAEIAFDVIGGSEISFEGLVQADYNYFDNDFANLNGDAPDGKDSDNELRRAELVLKGKGPGNIDWVVGYDAKADKWLDVNAKYKLGGDANHWFQAGQFKQPNSLEELSSTKNNDFISKSLVTNTFGVARRLGAAYRYGDNDWGVTASYFTRELTEHPAPTPHGPGYGVRGNWAPLNDKGSILHFGLSYMDYDTFQDTVRLRARPAADLAGQ